MLVRLSDAAGPIAADPGDGGLKTHIQNTVTVTGTMNPPAITKGTQGASGYTTQDLKDAGRVIYSASAVIGGVAAVTTEALLSLVPQRDGVANSAATSFGVTAGKRWRIQTILVSAKTTSITADNDCRFALRINPSGAVTASSPVLAIAHVGVAAGAAAQAAFPAVINIPDGLEISGTMQIGLTQVAAAVTGTVWATILGYEY